jgi:hypothetical protein
MAPGITLKRLAGRYAIARLAPSDPIPRWADGEGFVSISRTDEELSIICLEARVPPAVQHDGAWTCLAFKGPFAFDETGIALSVIRPLSENGIGILLVASFDTDHLLVKTAELERTRSLLTAAGHVLA